MAKRSRRRSISLWSVSPEGTGAFVRNPYQGIVKFETDGSLHICYRIKAERYIRPTRFGVAKNSGQTVLVLKRNVRQYPLVGPAVTVYEPVTSLRPVTRPANPGIIPPTVPALTLLPPQPSSQAMPSLYVNQEVSMTISPDSELLQGVWVYTSTDGKPVPAERQNEYVEFLKNRILLSNGTHGRFRLEDSKSPKQITITFASKSEGPVNGIYKIEGDRLTIASYNKSGKLIPTTFEPDPEAGIAVEVYERQKAVPPPMPTRPSAQPPSAYQAPRADRPPPTIRPPERNLLKEIDQLREQLRRLEKELKSR